MGKEISAMSRRDFLQLTGKSAIYSSVFLTGCAPMATDGSKRTARAIHIHHHYFPAELINEIKQHGKSLTQNICRQRARPAMGWSFGKGNRTGVDPEIIDVDKRLEVMRDGRSGDCDRRVATQRSRLFARRKTGRGPVAA